MDGHFGDHVRLHRRRRGLTQEELAERAGVSVRSVRKWENGQVAAPRAGTVRILADTLRLTGGDRDEFLHAALPGTAPRRTTRVPAQVPAAPGGFVAREREAAALDACLERAATEAVVAVISGPGGVGKTALALWWAHRARGSFPDGQLHADLHGFDPGGRAVAGEEVLRTLLASLGVTGKDGELPGLFRSTLAGRRMLIVLDNARDAAQVRPLLPGVPGCMVVVTSRDSLTGLAVTQGAAQLPLAVLSPADSLALLTARIGGDRVRADRRAAAEIVAACARLPLALAVIAARLAARPSFALREVAAGLRDPHTRWAALTGTDPATDVRAVLSWSYRMLPPAAARMFRLLGLHPVPVASVTALAALAGVPVARARHLLDTLCSASLATEPEPGRYTAHDLLLDYARELAPAAEQQEAQRRAIDFYLHSALAADRLVRPAQGGGPAGRTPPPPAAGLVPETVTDALAWFAAELPAVSAAFQLARRAGMDLHLWWLAWAMQTELERQWDSQEWIVSHREALDAALRLGDRALRATSEHMLANAYLETGDLTPVAGHLRTALKLYEQEGNRNGAALAHLNLGIAARRDGDHAGAIEHGTRALELYTEIGFVLGQARALNNLGYCHLCAGDHARAIPLCRRAVELHEAAGNPNGAGHALDSLATAYLGLGRPAEAADSYRRALEAFRVTRTRQYEAIVLDHLGDAELARGDASAAADAWEQALTLFTELGHPAALGVTEKLSARRPAHG